MYEIIYVYVSQDNVPSLRTQDTGAITLREGLKTPQSVKIIAFRTSTATKPHGNLVIQTTTAGSLTKQTGQPKKINTHPLIVEGCF